MRILRISRRIRYLCHHKPIVISTMDIFLIILGVLCLSQAVHTESLGRFGVETDVWDQLGAYQKSGAVAAFLRNTEFLKVEEPPDRMRVTSAGPPNVRTGAGTSFFEQPAASRKARHAAMHARGPDDPALRRCRLIFSAI